MAKFHLDRLRDKYEGIKISGNVYSDIVQQIVANNSSNVQKKVYNMNADRWKDFDNKYRPSRETRMVLPPEEEVLPKRGVQVRKAAEQGEMIRDSLRDSLTKDLRQSLFDTDTPYLKKRGVTAGRINPALINKFEKNIRQTFSTYARKDPKLGVPSNVHQIAVTEVRGTINDTKEVFTKKMLDENPRLVAKKKWIQNRSLAKEPRRGHTIVDGTLVDFDSFFKVPLYKKENGRNIKVGVTLMRYPHDPTAPASQVVGCNCDYDIVVTKIRKVA